MLVEINSPGGTVTGSEILFDALRDLSAKKPTVAVVGGLAASGGYIAAMGTDQIVAQPDLAGRLHRRAVPVSRTSWASSKSSGVNMETLKSAPLEGVAEPVRADYAGSGGSFALAHHVELRLVQGPRIVAAGYRPARSSRP